MIKKYILTAFFIIFFSSIARCNSIIKIDFTYLNGRVVINHLQCDEVKYLIIFNLLNSIQNKNVFIKQCPGETCGKLDIKFLRSADLIERVLMHDWKLSKKQIGNDVFYVKDKNDNRINIHKKSNRPANHK